MSVQSAKKAYQLTEWANQIQARLESGQTVKEWCNEQFVSPKTYYYRLKRVREELLETAGAKTMFSMPGKPEFAPLSLPRTINSAVTVQIGGLRADIHNDANFSTVEFVLRVLSQL